MNGRTPTLRTKVRSGIDRLQLGPVDHSQPCDPLQRISSLKPQVLAVLTALVAAGAAIFALSPMSSERSSRMSAAIAFVHTFVAIATITTWKNVRYRDRNYVVSDLFKSESISSQDVCLAVEARGLLWNAVRIHFKRPTRFGWHISFIPAGVSGISNSRVAGWRSRTLNDDRLAPNHSASL